MFSKTILIFQVTVALMGCVSYAFAYVPPAEQIFSLMPHQKHRQIRALVLTLETTFYGEDWPDGLRTFTETVSYLYPDRFLSTIKAPSGKKLYVVQEGKSLVAIDQKIISEEESYIDSYKDIFLYRSPESLIERLSKVGIDTKTVSFGRLEDKIAYVMGAVYPDESHPQLWVEKDTFRPLRLLFPPSGNSGKIEIRYDHYFNVGRGMWYPGRITFYENDKPVKEQALKTYKSSSKDDAFPEYMFDIEELKKSYTSVIEPERKGDASAGSEFDDVKQTIDDFQKAFE
jgi:hypothetical protein